eukprot:3300465-Prymnesium_polylepis.1
MHPRSTVSCWPCDEWGWRLLLLTANEHSITTFRTLPRGNRRVPRGMGHLHNLQHRERCGKDRSPDVDQLAQSDHLLDVIGYGAAEHAEHVVVELVALDEHPVPVGGTFCSASGVGWMEGNQGLLEDTQERVGNPHWCVERRVGGRMGTGSVMFFDHLTTGGHFASTGGRNHAQCGDACMGKLYATNPHHGPHVHVCSVWGIRPGVWSAGRAPGIKECNFIFTLTTGGHPVTTRPKGARSRPDQSVGGYRQPDHDRSSI